MEIHLIIIVREGDFVYFYSTCIFPFPSKIDRHYLTVIPKSFENEFSKFLGDMYFILSRDQEYSVNYIKHLIVEIQQKIHIIQRGT